MEILAVHCFLMPQATTSSSNSLPLKKKKKGQTNCHDPCKMLFKIIQITFAVSNVDMKHSQKSTDYLRSNLKLANLVTERLLRGFCP